MADATQSIGVLQFALNAVVSQQQTIANNIANQDTPGYQANQVTFQDSLAAALQQGGSATMTLIPEGLPAGVNGNNVSIAAEMTLLQENNLENKLVANALSAQFAILSAALSA
ncbi:MAG TPA: flagellar basal body protein [Candidatus Paceibacterota bacterium]|nr:flagellar basal body protein [Candidatus Paceibacterota bacterium]